MLRRNIIASQRWMSRRWFSDAFIAFSDGASRGNPGKAGCGAVLMKCNGDIVASAKQYLGENITNNVAEYYGLLLALELASQHNVQNVQIKVDSELIVKQMNGIYRVKNHTLQQLHEKAKVACKTPMQVTVQHVPRAENKQADELANNAIDEHDL